MPTFRFKALEDVLERKPKEVEFPSDRASEYYATNVFTQEAMQEYLPRGVLGGYAAKNAAGNLKSQPDCRPKGAMAGCT